jgi:pimeloyl-ACP methyl ester carboxylesterase
MPRDASAAARRPSARLFGAWIRGLARVWPPAADRILVRRFLTPRRRRTPGAGPRQGAPRFVKDGRVRIATWSRGRGPTVLLCHGWEGSAAAWEPMARALVAAGYRVVTFDMPAHGRSSGQRTSVAGMARAARVVAASVGPLHAVIGHSAGGTAAALALRDGLRADRAVLLAPTRRPADYLHTIVRAIGLPDDRATAAIACVYKEIGAAPARLDAVAAVAGLTPPGLVLHDRDDAYVPWTDGREIATAWPGCRFIETHGLGHGRLIEDEGVAYEVVRFLGERREGR